MSLLALKTLRDLRSAWAQSLALIAIVAIGIAAFVALAGAYRNLSASYDRTYRELRFADVTFSVDSAPQSAAPGLQRLRAVSAASGRLIVDAGLAFRGGEQVRARLIGLPGARRPAVNDLLVEQGRFLSSADANGVLVESNFAKAHRLGAGETITALVAGRRVPLTIAGIVASPEYLMMIPSRQDPAPVPRSFAVLFLPLARLQGLVGASGRINDIAVRLAPGSSPAATVRAVRARLSPYRLQSTVWRKDQPSNASLQMDLDMFNSLATLMPALILLAAAASLYLMLGRMVRAQQPLIGLMKALGYRDRTVRRHYLGFALTIGVAGSAVGVLTGLLLARAVTRAYADELGIPLVATQLHPELILIAVLLSVGLAALAGRGPARATGRLAPAQAMRLDPAASALAGRASLLERLVQLPLGLRLPLRNVFRARRRSFSTAVGVVFSFVLVLMTLALFDSTNYMLRHNYDHIERWDIAASFPRPLSPSAIGGIRGWPGVRQLEPSTQFPAELQATHGSKDVLIKALAAGQEMHVLQLPSGLPPARALANGQIVLTRALANKLELDPGDPLTVRTAQGTRRLRLGGTSDEFITMVAYVSPRTAATLTGTPAANDLYLRVDPGHATTIKAALYQAGAASVQLKADTKADVRSLFGLYYLILAVMLAFALAMAFALIFNAMTVNVLERQRELGTMRALGSRPSRIRSLIAAENTLLWLVTLVPGLLLGRWVAIAFGNTMPSDLFSFTIKPASSSYLLTGLGILTTMLIAAVPAIRHVNRADLAQATKVLA